MCFISCEYVWTNTLQLDQHVRWPLITSVLCIHDSRSAPFYFCMTRYRKFMVIQSDIMSICCSHFGVKIKHWCIHTYIHINVYDMLRVKTIADIKLLPTFYKAKARVDIWWEFERWLSKTAIIVYVNNKGSDECTSMQSHQNLAVSLFGSSQRKVVTKNNTKRFFLQLAITSCRFFLPIF